MHVVKVLGTLILSVVCISIVHADETFNIDTIIGHIEELENVRDPKCYATASRLEDFIYGTPLAHQARFEKNLLQKQWLMNIWLRASTLARQSSTSDVSEHNIREAAKPIVAWRQIENGHWQVTLGSGQKLTIHKDDKRQYSTIAYSLRSLLAVQQELMLSDALIDYVPLDNAATDVLAEALDFYLLSVLQIADKEARHNDEYEVSKPLLVNVWNALSNLSVQNQVAKQPHQEIEKKLITPTTLKRTIAQKLRSYQQYNALNNQLFVRNLQVFFARSRWPEDSQEARDFRQKFTENVIAFAGDIYKGAQEIALKNGHQFILESDVFEYTQQILPHNINEYEDAIFFPHLPAGQRVTIEAYDMDAFRDSGIHWQYLDYALNDQQYSIYLEPDPFAAELIVENVAQYGVLILRVTGDIGRRSKSERIKPSHFTDAVNEVHYLTRENNIIKTEVKPEQPLLSASQTEPASLESHYFSPFTKESGIDYMHRSADWLSRLLRSYLKTGDGEGTIVIPPAFGGSGIAAGDINNDGLDDLLMLGGLGNRLYLNLGKGKFSDITESAGIKWLRKDNTYGETRQPLIADLDNDGWQDIVITYVNDLHRVYRNNGDGTFEDKTDTAGLGGDHLVGGPATVFDYDGDGLLDIYITYFGNYVKGVLPTLKRRNTNGSPNMLFKNSGGFKFRNVSAGSGLENTGWGQAVTHTDFNGDGKQDLIVGNDFGVNSYYQNLGKGKFIDIAAQLGTDKPSYTMGIGLGDLNQDRISDVYISNIVTMNKDEKYVLPSSDTEMKFNPDKLANMRVVEANDLFLSRSGSALSFELSDKVGRGYSSTGWSWDADFLDFDNDGDDDLYVLNGMNDYNVYSRENSYYKDPLTDEDVDVLFPEASKERNVFFVNNNGRLSNNSKESGLDIISNGRSATYIDFDNDGDMDIVTNDYHEKARVFKNNAEMLGRRWLKVGLKGAPKLGVNLDAIGAKVVVSTSDGWSRTRELNGTIGYMSVHSKLLHFGLLNHQKADVLVIWPNGRTSLLKNVNTNQQITIKYTDKNTGIEHWQNEDTAK